MPKTEHYTAVVDIHRTTVTEHPGTGRGDDKTFRDNKEVSKLVLRADTLEKLQTKLTAHIALLEE